MNVTHVRVLTGMLLRVKTGHRTTLSKPRKYGLNTGALGGCVYLLGSVHGVIWSNPMVFRSRIIFSWVE